jgi:hypothetical protein
MTSEAIGTGKPVVVLFPADYRRSHVLEAVLLPQEQRGRLIRRQMNQIPAASIFVSWSFSPLPLNHLPGVVSRALSKIGESRPLTPLEGSI